MAHEQEPENCTVFITITAIELLDKPEERLDELKDLAMAHILLLSPEDEKAHALHNDQAERIAFSVSKHWTRSPRRKLSKWTCCLGVDLPDFSEWKDAKGNILDEHSIDPDDVLPEDGWVQNVANDGTYYYWNLKPRDATWDRP
jgi:hypothetical protein